MNPISPGLSVNELDFPQFQQALGTTRVCMVGGATKGPVNKPTLVSSQGSLVEKFGPPVLNDLGLQAALQFLAAGSQLLYVRVANGAATATRTVSGQAGGSPAGKATGSVQFPGSVNPSDADYLTVSDGVTPRVFEFDNNNATTQAGAIGVTIGGTAAATMANLIAAINNSAVAVAVDASVSAPRANLTARTGGTAGNVAITVGSGAGHITVAGMAGGTAAVAGTTTSVVTFAAASPGTWGNAVQVQVTTPSAAFGAPAGNFDLAVLAPPATGAPPAVVEQFTNLSLDPASDRFADTALVGGIANELPASRWVTSDALAAGTPAAGTYALGTAGGTAGADGIAGLTAADYVGTVNGQTPTGLKAVRNAESTEYSLLAVPGVSHATVVAAMVEHAEFRRDHLALIDPPFGLDADTVVAWVNGQQPGGVPNSPAVALSSSYATVSWPWLKMFDAYNKKDVWVPPSAAVAIVMMNGSPWLPSAGANRGVVTAAKDLETSPDQTTRDTLGASNVNPFVVFPEGVQRYGNKTLQRVGTLTQSEHARRTLIYAQKLCAGAVRYLVFEANDPTTWRKFQTLCNVALSGIKSARGLTQFAVVCDANTNPPDARQRGEMRGSLIAQPVDVAERIIMSFAATSTGTSFGDEQTGSAAA